MMTLDQLGMPSSLHESTERIRERKREEPSYGVASRHEILHGYTSDDDDELNGLRSIALVDLLRDVKERLG